MEGICKPANLQPLSGKRKSDFPVLQQRKEFTRIRIVCTAYSPHLDVIVAVYYNIEAV